MQTDYQAIVAAPFGALGVRVADGVLAGIDLLPGFPEPRAANDVDTQAICAQLTEYLKNPHHPLDFPMSVTGTPFQRRVWRAMRAIPVGETLTYTELAQRISSGPRAVANACGTNPIPVVIPCHRVVAKSGLGGFMGGREATSLSIKQWLLAHERGESSTAG
jgi:methylated-DNA-[protein]-cysteine S-methyltransferase